MKFLNEIDGASRIKTDPLNQFVTQVEKTKIAQIDNKADKSQILTNVPTNAKFTDTVYVHPTGTNPHSTTKADVGLGSVDNVKQATKAEFDTHNTDSVRHITGAERTSWNAKSNLALGTTSATAYRGDLGNAAYAHSQAAHARVDATNTTNHAANGSITVNGVAQVVYTHPAGTNPHGTTKTDVGLGSVDNKSSATIRSEITSSNVTSALGYTPLNSTLKGVNGGLAELDSSGKVPASQLPSYVDDVLEFTALANFPATGETGKIYTATNTNMIYRWSGTGYVEISSTIAIGITSATAHRGDHGAVAYNHSQVAHAPSNAQKNSDITKAEIETKLTGVIGTHSHTVTKANVGLGSVDNTSDLGKPISTATQTALNGKVDNSQVLTNVPAGAKFTDTIYTHSSSHPASMITESTAQRFVSDVEKSAWNAKWNYSETTIKAVKVSNAINADTVNGKIVAENVPVGAKFTDTVYSHPSGAGNNHMPSGGTIGQVLKNTASGTATWQAETLTTVNGKTGAILKADIVALGMPAQDTVYVHPAGTNPHGTTKANVGLGSADNTADSAKNVLSATRFTTARTINGVSFNGTANITIADSTKEPSFTKLTAFNKNFGTAAGTVTQGNDSRLSNARTPTTHSASSHSDINQSLLTTNTVQFAKVGVGTATPNESLDVVGNARIRSEGSMKFGGTGASDSAFEIKYNASTKSLDFNFLL